MKRSRMHRIVLATGLGLVAGWFCAAAVAGDVYQWKDARGVTQYSSTPPANANYKVRSIRNNGAATAAAVAVAKPAENQQCGMARLNVAALQGKGAVQQDSNGDGKPDKTLTDAERTSQLALAQATLNANNCTATAALPK